MLCNFGEHLCITEMTSLRVTGTKFKRFTLMYGRYGFSQFAADIYNNKMVKLLSNFLFVGNINSINVKGAGKFKLLIVFLFKSCLMVSHVFSCYKSNR